MMRPGYTMPDTSNTVTPTGEDPSAMAAASLTGSGGAGKIKGTSNPYAVAGPNGHSTINWGLWDGDKLPCIQKCLWHQQCCR
jgi:hypothetical protein